MDITSFWSVSIRENIPADQSIIIVGDRRDIQRRAIEIGVRAMVITSNLGMDDDTLALARSKGTSVIISPYDSATTSWIVRTASVLERIIDRTFSTVDADLRISDVRKKFSPTSPHALLVVDDEGKLEGILTKTDLLRSAQTKLVLVDHNEMSQAVTGADEVTITEIIDHHRLGALNTPQPILFINEPVGSTCTIVAEFNRSNWQTKFSIPVRSFWPTRPTKSFVPTTRSTRKKGFASRFPKWRNLDLAISGIRRSPSRRPCRIFGKMNGSRLPHSW